MSKIEELQIALEQARISLSLDGDSLVVSAPKGALTTELRDTLRLHKSAMIEALRIGGAARITTDTTTITPDMLPLIDLSQSDIDRIVARTPGGVANIQEITELTSLQEGLLFHHLLGGTGDTFLQLGQISFASRALLDRYLAAIQAVVDRHDILRTDIVADGLSTPAQVVRRHAALHVTTPHFNPADGPVPAQLARRFDPAHTRIDLGSAPLMHIAVAHDPARDRWHMLLLLHHIIDDITSLAILTEEVYALANYPEARLPAPQPFRNLIAQIRLGTTDEEHRRFFSSELAGVTTPTLPLGLVAGPPGAASGECRHTLAPDLSRRLRAQARGLGVSVASLCHHAWAQLLAQLTGQREVVFATLLSGRMHAGAGANRAMGPFVNALPIRLEIDDTGTAASIRRTHARLADLLGHEHASLAAAQRCAGVPPGTPLLSSLLNYRHNRLREEGPRDPDGPVLWTRFEERTPYPIALHVDDYGDDLGLVAQIAAPHAPEHLAAYMEQALASLAEALEHAPGAAVRGLAVLPTDARLRLEPAPDPARAQASLRRQKVHPDTGVVRHAAVLGQLWDELLGTQEGSQARSFRAAGGDSLMSVRLRGRAAAVGIHVGVADILEADSLQELASRATAIGPERPGAEKRADRAAARPPKGLLTLHRATGTSAPILCIPGAGSSVTDFMPFVQALGDGRTAYGLQHRGFDGGDAPAATVGEAARHAIAQLEAAGIAGPVHLVGHSYGGWIAFELALRHPRLVASLALIDTEASDADGRTRADRSEEDALRAYVRTHEQVASVAPLVDEAVFGGASAEAVLASLHVALVGAGVLPPRSRPDLLAGPYATFAAAYRDGYRPEAAIDGALLLALAGGDAARGSESTSRKVTGWQAWASAVEPWTGPGSHFSMLRRPHVADLARWWSDRVGERDPPGGG